mgnify:FL=1
MKVTIIAGARPNFMKIAPLMRAIKAAKAAGKISLPVWSTQVRTKIKVWNLLCLQTWICRVPMYICM